MLNFFKVTVDFLVSRFIFYKFYLRLDFFWTHLGVELVFQRKVDFIGQKASSKVSHLQNDDFCSTVFLVPSIDYRCVDFIVRGK